MSMCSTADRMLSIQNRSEIVKQRIQLAGSIAILKIVFLFRKILNGTKRTKMERFTRCSGPMHNFETRSLSFLTNK
jgi:hypothetical protein